MMIEPQRVASLIQAALIADSYSLGLHWIYDHELLDRQPLNLNELHPPLSHWHGTKAAGDLTHHGDQLWHLYQYLQQDEPDIERYLDIWAGFVEHYHGYIDKATAAAYDNIRHGISPSGSATTELSVTSRVACPLLYTTSNQAYLEQVEVLTRMTHESDIAIASCRFFGAVLLDCLAGTAVADAIVSHLAELPSSLQTSARQGIASADEDTRTVLRQFGIAGEIRYGLPGIMHLIHRYQDPVRLLQENALAGGDSSARGMISLMLMVAEQPKILKQLPPEWIETILNRRQKN
ncbi:ADP-ribosylglycohydrolase family protein [Marinobacterium maritimum]|uniref:ADP-ribosylglycohydrolase family protein n=1 Tax=Marinobacterium maritimum TaxID=500162 RepID=A0ABN1I351_9GAMM